MTWIAVEGEESKENGGAEKKGGQFRKKAAKKQLRQERREQAKASLIQELNNLRAELKEITQQLTLKQDAHLMHLIQMLGGSRGQAPESTLPATKRLAAMLKKIQELKLKPKKGRLKDLVHLTRLLDALSDKISE
ncbi:MAG: hypothetical protein AB1439_06595 [candidate division FCPU426 bacterium]